MFTHIRPLFVPAFQETVKYAGCTDCAVSCQSACKTSCTVGNIVCSVSTMTSPAITDKASDFAARR